MTLEETMPAPLLLTRSQVRKAMSAANLNDAVRQALLLRAEGSVAPPVSGQIALPAALLHLKAGAVTSPATLSVKANLRPHGKAATGLIVLFDVQGAAITAVMDSADITAARTGALAAIAADCLAPAARTLTILGAGPVARAALLAVTSLVPIRSIHVWSRSRAKAEDLARSLPRPIVVDDTASTAVRDAELVITATPASQPLLEACDLSSHAVILAMGADSPGKRELGKSVLAQSTIVVDQREDALKVGECAYLSSEGIETGLIELGDLLAGRASLPERRLNSRDFVVFDSVGSAIVDTLVAKSILAEAIRLDIGLRLAFDA
jgi:ornithine cyclodeaminase/alanine dehydrogenase-like protein (mu-crystallin family)